MPEEVSDILDDGRDRPGGGRRRRSAMAAQDLPNPQRDKPRQSYLGIEQKAWLKDAASRLAQAVEDLGPFVRHACACGPTSRTCPSRLRARWAGTGYGLMKGGYGLDHGEIADMLKTEGITGLAIVAGDKHSFWAARFSKKLPPEAFEPVGVEFITGSISAQTLGEVMALTLPARPPLRRA